MTEVVELAAATLEIEIPESYDQQMVLDRMVREFEQRLSQQGIPWALLPIHR